eukprot:m.92683 g.92683  ORF g.92683 m.92683 type:complete len:333 (+) comp15072_c0_seq1:39-1037(+)
MDGFSVFLDPLGDSKDDSIPVADKDTLQRTKKVMHGFSESAYILANEPSLGLYRLQEHVTRSVPQLVERRKELDILSQRVESTVVDADYALSALEPIQSVPQMAGVLASVERAIAAQRKLNALPPRPAEATFDDGRSLGCPEGLGLNPPTPSMVSEEALVISATTEHDAGNARSSEPQQNQQQQEERAHQQQQPPSQQQQLQQQPQLQQQQQEHQQEDTAQPLPQLVAVPAETAPDQPPAQQQEVQPSQQQSQSSTEAQAATSQGPLPQVPAVTVEALAANSDDGGGSCTGASALQAPPSPTPSLRGLGSVKPKKKKKKQTHGQILAAKTFT